MFDYPHTQKKNNKSRKMEETNFGKKHFVLVHGACHGAWCWYKLKPLLEHAGQRVTVLDLAAAGINPTKIFELHSLRDYTESLIQLMSSIPDDEKVVLVGHSLGGLSIALVTEMFPQKIDVAVFLTAFMPDSRHTPSFIFDQFMASMPSAEEYWLDAEFNSSDDPNDTITSILFGPRFMSKLYKLSPPEDYELAMTLKRPSSMFLEDLSRPESKLSEEKYGSVRRVYVMCDEDEAIPPAFQSWMIKNDEVKEVRMLKHADHMPMFCMPKQLCYCLLEIALKHYAANSDDSPTSDPN